MRKGKFTLSLSDGIMENGRIVGESSPAQLEKVAPPPISAPARSQIVFSDDDRLIFEQTLEEVAVKTGWEIFCRVLMGNHYHLAFLTPQPNLEGF